MNPYSKELIRKGAGELSKNAKSYLKTVSHFEKLYHMYRSAKNKKDVMITQKYALETYGLLAKGDLIVLICVAHNRTSRSVGEIMHE